MIARLKAFWDDGWGFLCWMIVVPLLIWFLVVHFNLWIYIILPLIFIVPTFVLFWLLTKLFG